MEEEKTLFINNKRCEREQTQKKVQLPNKPFNNLSIDISEQHVICGTIDYKAFRLRYVWSGTAQEKKASWRLHHKYEHVRFEAAKQLFLNRLDATYARFMAS